MADCVIDRRFSVIIEEVIFYERNAGPNHEKNAPKKGT